MDDTKVVTIRQGIATGECLVGDGNEVAHIDLMIGTKDGPVGTAFANALANQTKGHTNLIPVLEPNVPVIDAITVTKVTMKTKDQAVLMFGPAQRGVAEALQESIGDGDDQIPTAWAESDELVIIVGVFIHWEANDKAKILEFNKEATKTSIARAVKKIKAGNAKDQVEAALKYDSSTGKHPFQS